MAMPTKAQCEDGALYLSTRQVRQRYGGVSEMWIERRLKDKAVGFPQPALIISRRRFWTVDSLVAWERAQAVGAV